MRRRLSLDEIKQIELDILIHFKEYCKDHNLKFYLAGGTLLGAVRHQGFIPWDDDIDVCMPRTDYEKLIATYTDDHGKFRIVFKGFYGFDVPFAKMIRIDTEINTQYGVREIDKHIWIDIFPVDGLPDDIHQVEEIYKKCDFYRRIYLLADAVLGEGKTTFRKYSKYVLKPLANLYGKRRCIDHIEKAASQNPYETSDYVGIVTWGLYGVGERMLKSEFERSVEVDFEGYKFPAFSCWDSYLHGLYKNYMELPPVENRRTHDMEAYLIE